MNIIPYDYESVWSDMWPQNKCRSLWPIVHGPVILLDILKTVWCMNIILGNYESVWHNIWPQNVGHYDLYFMVQWFCLIAWKLFDIWTPSWDYESVWPDVWPQNIYRTLWPIFHGPVILPYILKTIQWLNIILLDYESIWPDIQPQNICRSLCTIFHGPLNLPYILKTVWCMNIILSDYEPVWHIWPWNKCRSLWPYISWYSDFALIS